MNHIDALNLRLSNERIRLSNAKSSQERELRKVWISQIEKEIIGEEQFLSKFDAMSDEELLTALSE